MHEVEITGMTRSYEKIASGKGVVLAYFDVIITPGILARGCAFVRYSNGALVCWPPHMGKDKRRGVDFINGTLKRELASKAEDAFLALGGKLEDLHPTAGCT